MFAALSTMARLPVLRTLSFARRRNRDGRRAQALCQALDDAQVPLGGLAEDLDRRAAHKGRVDKGMAPCCCRASAILWAKTRNVGLRAQATSWRFFLRRPRYDCRQPRRSAMKTLLALIGILAILCVIAAAAFFFGGFYDVSASRDDPAWVKSALANVRLASISRHAIDKPPISLDDSATVQTGARAFSERGCINCHG